MDAIVRARRLCKDYVFGDQVVHAVREVDIEIERGDFVAIMGPSGSGKSSFMNLIGALDVPNSGVLELDGRDVAAMTRDELAEVRNTMLGFVFQQFVLLPRSTALDNVILPLLYAHRPRFDPDERGRACLERVGLGHRLDHYPKMLSGGQQQRVAIARALANDPRIILADEPTGALDTKTSYEIMELFSDLNRQGITIILVTHEPEIATYARRQILFRDGRVVEDRRTPGGGPFASGHHPGQGAAQVPAPAPAALADSTAARAAEHAPEAPHAPDAPSPAPRADATAGAARAADGAVGEEPR